jgi:lipid A ethanolaminephosphotransferase
MYSVGKFIGGAFDSGSDKIIEVGQDAEIPATDIDRELIILVVGETARADHFSLNGYSRKTNPHLEKEQVFSFNNTWSCGTSTAESVPCMLSFYNQDDYSKDKAVSTENLLDVLQRAGVNVLWLDNNSDSKGMALRVAYENFKTADNNPMCDEECRDEGMLQRVQRFIDEHAQGDIFIVLHQMGNHGPAYYKRYPPEFEQFKPVCKTNQLENCTSEEINNAYDNAILYTDYFLTKVIELLKRNSPQFEAGMFYASDHGESLGEYGVYLHGLPYSLAPDVQKHVPMIMWFNDKLSKEDLKPELLNAKISNHYSHDNISHTVLSFFEVDTNLYDPSLNIVDRKNEVEDELLAY